MVSRIPVRKAILLPKNISEISDITAWLKIGKKWVVTTGL